jgi:hypothetical protein
MGGFGFEFAMLCFAAQQWFSRLKSSQDPDLFFCFPGTTFAGASLIGVKKRELGAERNCQVMLPLQ